MEKKNMKKLLASLGIASLISAGGLTLSGCATSGSGWTADKDSAGGAVEKEVKKKAGDSGWTATKDSAGSAEKAKEDVKKKAGDSGWTASK